jgi:exopolyphosphatase/guanosine-5'-triphosphate,3'-diphosphate pyrophosphatase
VATSAVREARNREEIVQRARKEAGLNLEVISGREEARLICLGVLHGKAPRTRSLCLDIGGGSTEVASAEGERPTNLWSVSLGCVRLAELFDAQGAISGKKLKLLRDYAGGAVAEAIPRRFPGYPRIALGSSGTVRAVVGFAAAEGTAHATSRQLSRTVDELVDMGTDELRRRFDPRRAEIIVSGAVILEALVHHLGLKSVVAVERGLRHGVLWDLFRRRNNADQEGEGHSVGGAARVMGRRFYFDERHASQVTRLALTLFDELADVHQLPAAVRPYLEAAALLHDVGNSVSYQKHHRHTQYLIQNADLPGLADRERDLVARVARYHRRSPPEIDHAGMAGLSLPEARLVRKLATLLRVADALDRSHHQPITGIRTRRSGRDICLRIKSRAPVDLELWDVAHEAPLFRKVFGHALRWEVARA